MATQVQWRGGSTSEHSTFTGAAREVTVDTSKQTLVVHDGSTAGGHPLQKQYPAQGSQTFPTYTFSGDINTGIYSPGADQVAISTNGSGALFIDANGNVGIGAVAASGRRLHVQGAGFQEVLVEKTDATTGAILLAADSGLAGIYTRSTGADSTAIPLAFHTGNTEHLRITSTGELKHIGGGSEGSPGVYFAGSAPSNSLYVQATTGNVGFGTDSPDPSARLTVSKGPSGGSANANAGLVIEDNSNTYLNLMSPNTFNNGIYFGDSDDNDVGYLNYSHSNNHLAFGVNTSERLRITSDGTVNIKGAGTAGVTQAVSFSGTAPVNSLVVQATTGNVGIGTANPSSLLTLRSDSSGTSTLLRLENLNASGGITTQTARILALFDYNNSGVAVSAGAITFGKEGTYTGGTGNVDSYLSFSTVLNNSTAEKCRITSDGKLLVGTDTARSTAGVTWQSQLEGGALTGLGITSNSTATTGAYLSLAKTRGTSVDPNISVNENDNLGHILFSGADGTDANTQAAEIKAQVDGTPGANVMPSRLVFSTWGSDGTPGVKERMRIASDGKLTVPSVYSLTTADAANVRVTAAGDIVRSTSSIKYKTDVETLEDRYADNLLACRPVWFRSLSKVDNPSWGYWGFIAEEVAEIDPRLVFWKTHETEKDEDGNTVQVELEDPIAEGVQYDRFVPHLLNLIKRQGEAIADLQAEVAALKAQ